MRLKHFSMMMIFLVIFSILSVSHVELRPIAKDATKLALDYEHKSSFVKPRPVSSPIRANLIPLIVSLMFLLLQLLANPHQKPPKFNRFSHVSIAMKRLFLMPIKRTSTAI